MKPTGPSDSDLLWGDKIPCGTGDSLVCDKSLSMKAACHPQRGMWLANPPHPAWTGNPLYPSLPLHLLPQKILLGESSAVPQPVFLTSCNASCPRLRSSAPFSRRRETSVPAANEGPNRVSRDSPRQLQLHLIYRQQRQQPSQVPEVVSSWQPVRLGGADSVSTGLP
ncbi:hypothetical protein VTI28DRAFT_1121 [Corynascus sepedonium]